MSSDDYGAIKDTQHTTTEGIEKELAIVPKSFLDPVIDQKLSAESKKLVIELKIKKITAYTDHSGGI
jgi:hypothetical protein